MAIPVSLITTVYNRADYLPACLDSILAQTYPDFDFLIWDDGSTDDSLEVAQRYAQKDDLIRIIAAPHNQGFPLSIKSAIAASERPMQLLHCPQRGANYARNFGFTQAQGDYIQWLGSVLDLWIKT